jgi:hypothetical protein
MNEWARWWAVDHFLRNNDRVLSWAPYEVPAGQRSIFYLWKDIFNSIFSLLSRSPSILRGIPLTDPRDHYLRVPPWFLPDRFLPFRFHWICSWLAIIARFQSNCPNEETSGSKFLCDSTRHFGHNSNFSHCLTVLRIFSFSSKFNIKIHPEPITSTLSNSGSWQRTRSSFWIANKIHNVLRKSLPLTYWNFKTKDTGSDIFGWWGCQTEGTRSWT